MKVNDGKLKCRRNYLQTDSWQSLPAAPSTLSCVGRGQLRARSAVCPGGSCVSCCRGWFLELLKDTVSHQPYPKAVRPAFVRAATILFDDGMGNRSIVSRGYRGGEGRREGLLSARDRGYRCFDKRERFDFGEEGAGTMRMERKKKTRKRNYRRSVNNNVGYRATDATRKRVSSAAANRLLYGRGL